MTLSDRLVTSMTRPGSRATSSLVMDLKNVDTAHLGVAEKFKGATFTAG